ncbi:unnamed protein product, partial [Onchocerca ochengi]
CTLGYQNANVPSLGNWLLGELPNGILNVAVYYKIYRIKPEWKNENMLKHWLYDLYEEKDELLERYYQRGVFPTDSQNHPSVIPFQTDYPTPQQEATPISSEQFSI